MASWLARAEELRALEREERASVQAQIYVFEVPARAMSLT